MAPRELTREERRRARERRTRAARRFRPDKVDLLLVAEAPPENLSRYFYFTDVREHDSLFRYVYRGITGREPTRHRKADHLRELCGLGVYLIDLQPDPLDERPLAGLVPKLLTRCRQLDPGWIILIKTDVFDAAYAALADAGFPVGDVRIPYPGRGQQRRFEDTFRRALDDWHRAASLGGLRAR